MLPPLTIFSKLKISESNLRIIVISAFAMYFLILYEVFPQYLFAEDFVLFTLILPLIGVLISLNIKKINLKNFSIKDISIKGKNKNSTKELTENSTSEENTIVASEGNSEIEAMLADTNSENNRGTSEMEALLAKAESEGKENGDPEIKDMLAKTDPEGTIEGNSEIEALLAGANTEDGENYSDNSLENSDAELMLMEKLEPIENDIQTIKTDFDQFKQDLTTVKEEVEILSNSFESTLTDIKLLTTDMNNPLNFMKDESSSFKENIQTINVDALVKKPDNSPETKKPEHEKEPAVQEPAVQESINENISELPEDIISLIDELSRDFGPEEVLELTKVHCKGLNMSIDEKQLKEVINKKNNSKSSVIENNEVNSEMEDLLAKILANEVK